MVVTVVVSAGVTATLLLLVTLDNVVIVCDDSVASGMDDNRGSTTVSVDNVTGSYEEKKNKIKKVILIDFKWKTAK